MSICPACNGTGEIEITESKQVTEHQLTHIKNMLASGMTYRAIAAALGKSPAVIYKHAKRMGVNSKFRKNLVNSVEARDALAQTEIEE